MLVGNDIVDLHDPWSQPRAIHDRFDSRAFTPGERARIRASRCAHRLRWSMWAAKESAFKVARKLDREVRFFPREFAVRMLDDTRAEVSHGVGRFSVWLERADGWLHALAVPVADAATGYRSGVHGGAAGEDPMGACARVGRVGVEGSGARGDRASVRVRELARSAVGSVMNISPTEIEIVTEEGIPTLRRRDERLPVDLSLSHHGRFVACAWAVGGQ